MRLLVATDGSEFSGLALVKTAEIAQAVGAEVVVLTVSQLVNLASYGALGLGPDAVYEVPTKEQADAILKEAANFLQGHGAKVTTEHRLGNPAEIVLAVAEESGADLIVVGSHGRSGIQRFLLGSVSSQILSHAPCSVLVAKSKSRQGLSSADAAELAQLPLHQHAQPVA